MKMRTFKRLVGQQAITQLTIFRTMEASAWEIRVQEFPDGFWESVDRDDAEGSHLWDDLNAVHAFIRKCGHRGVITIDELHAREKIRESTITITWSKKDAL